MHNITVEWSENLPHENGWWIWRADKNARKEDYELYDILIKEDGVYITLNNGIDHLPISGRSGEWKRAAVHCDCTGNVLGALND